MQQVRKLISICGERNRVNILNQLFFVNIFLHFYFLWKFTIHRRCPPSVPTIFFCDFITCSIYSMYCFLLLFQIFLHLQCFIFVFKCKFLLLLKQPTILLSKITLKSTTQICLQILYYSLQRKKGHGLLNLIFNAFVQTTQIFSVTENCLSPDLFHQRKISDYHGYCDDVSF